MDPDMRTFTITMPAVGVFLLGAALCCYCSFKYGLQRWYEHTLEKTRTQSRTGITYAASLQYKKEQLEHALRKVTKLRKVEPTRADLQYEAVALKEGIRMLHEHLHNSERYADYCAAQRRPSELNVSGVSTQQQAVSSIDPWTRSSEAGSSPASSDCGEGCHNPKHRELELYLMSTGGAILPSMLAYSGGAAPRLAGASPLERRTDGEGGSLNASPASPDSPPSLNASPASPDSPPSLNASPASPDSPPPPPSPEWPPKMPPNWQQRSPIVNTNFTFSPRLEV